MCSSGMCSSGMRSSGMRSSGMWNNHCALTHTVLFKCYRCTEHSNFID
jgi:hypothetical protein